MIHIIKNYRYYLGGLIVLSLIIFGMIIGRRSTLASGSPRVMSGRIEEIRRMRHLELVTYHFESLVNVVHEEKSDKVYLLLIIPAKVSCYIDLGRVGFHVGDTLVRIRLPEPVIESPVLDLDSARVLNLNERYVTASKSAYETVIRNVQRALAEAKQDVLKRAEVNGIREETSQLAQNYFESLLAGFGYDVEFIATKDLTETGTDEQLSDTESGHTNILPSDSITAQPADIVKGMIELGKIYRKAFQMFW